MKRNNAKVPEFDEIIFENRNKNYGAYKLRKNNKSVTSLSILGGIAVSAILITALSFKTKEGPVSKDHGDYILKFENNVGQIVVKPPIVKPPAALIKSIANLKPEVTDDTSKVTGYIPTAEEVQNTTQNGSVTDTAKYTEPVETVIPPDPEPVITVQEMPEFPGGPAALLKYVGENLVYPQESQINNIEGKVILKFVVKADGSVDRIEILRSIDPLLDNEAIRVVKTLPRFKPGRQSGIAVPVWFMLPVTFRIQNN
jgi:periplasmic protein TonB